MSVPYRLKRCLLAALALALLCALSACSQRPAVHVLDGDPRAGLSAFKFEGCAACHAIAGVSVGESGPALDGEGGRRAPAWLRRFMATHLRSVEQRPLPVRDEHDLIAYLESLQ